MRGTRAVRAACGRAGGIIPAYAGNTRWMIPPVRARGDHPRVCGEHCGEHSARFGVLGSSPRMRGTHSRCRRAANVTGIIPAYAGNTMMTPRLTTATWDHPRVCGEHDPLVPSVCDVLGSSPRMRGTLGRRVVGLCLVGIIPAYAGNTTARNASTKAKRDHPRVCGEHSRRGSAGLSFGGSSPRMRGTPFVVIAVTVWRGIIPAYAGNTLPVLPNPFSPRDHPRVCGEHGEIDVCMAGNMGSSPRMRGTRQERVERRGRLGIIPAYAGNTRRESTAAQYPEDHPRVCGEHFHSWFGTVHGLGSSPRMRGTLDVELVGHVLAGIIPAYAGNT